MTKTIMKLENVSLTIDKLKALTKNNEESMAVFRDCRLDVDEITTYVEDVIYGLQEVHSIIYNHKADKVYIDNLIKCKDYYYNKGYLEWGTANFIDATYELFDVVIQNAGEGMKPIAESVLGESFMDLFSTDTTVDVDLQREVSGELWNFIEEDADESHYLFLSKFNDDLISLRDLLDDYTVKLVDVHRYVYGYDNSMFSTVYGDNIAMIKHYYFKNRHKSNILKNSSFMTAIGFLHEAITNKIWSRESILELVNMLFEDEFEGLTDFKVNEFNEFHQEVCNFYNELQDLLSHGYGIDTPENEVLHKVDELFSKHVTL